MKFLLFYQRLFHAVFGFATIFIFAKLTGAATIPGVFNTGVGTNGALQADGTVDPHYQLSQSADVTWPGPNAFVVNAGFPGLWMPNSAISKWIAPTAAQNGAGNSAGDYKYRLKFDLTGLEPATAIITGQWASDNDGTALLLNGVPMALNISGYFTEFSPTFTIDSGFVDGTNTLDFVVNNSTTSPSPTGLRTEISGTAEPISPAGTAPSILTQPASISVALGEYGSLRVRATGGHPLNFQWRLNGGNLSGATNSGLIIGSVSSSNAGHYDVVVSNPWGSVTSIVAAVRTLVRLGPSSRRTGLVISEIMYHPKARTDGRNLQFI